MEARKSKVLFNYTASRESNSLQDLKRPNFDKYSVFKEIGYTNLRRNDSIYVNFGLSFCKTSKRCYDLAAGDDGGFVTLFDTRRNTKKISEWCAHEETGICGQVILDVGWIKEDTQILTAAGDDTIKVWDVEEKKCLATLWGHRDWIESICSHPTNDDIFVSGSKDRSFRLWDLRCKSTVSIPNEDTIFSTAVVERANLYHRSDGGRVDAMGLTSVLWLKDQFIIATAGSKHSTVKFWDTRFLKQGVTYKGPLPKSTEKQKLHGADGITSLSQDERGVLLTASSMDNRIYLYNILELEKRALSYFEVHRIRVYSKAAISPDALNIASGCDYGTTYVWQVNKPQERTILMPANGKEDAYKVDWSCCEPGKLATGGNFNSCFSSVLSIDPFNSSTWQNDGFSLGDSVKLSKYGIKILKFQNNDSPYAIQRIIAIPKKVSHSNHLRISFHQKFFNCVIGLFEI